MVDDGSGECRAFDFLYLSSLNFDPMGWVPTQPSRLLLASLLNLWNADR